MSPSPRLSFLIAGAQKCGTTALAAYLAGHPALEMARPKETHFFDRESGVDWRRPDYSALDGYYEGGPDRLRGEATPVTLYWTPAHYRVLTYNPDMRFIVMLRDPAARALSHWRMNRTNGLDALPFAEAIRGGRLRMLGDGPQSGLSRHFSYVERGYYGRQLALLSSLFPLTNILVLKQDDLLREPDGVLARIAGFLEVAPFAPVEPALHNVTPADTAPPMTSEDADYLKALFRDDLARLAALTGVQLGPTASGTAARPPAARSSGIPDADSR